MGEKELQGFDPLKELGVVEDMERSSIVRELYQELDRVATVANKACAYFEADARRALFFPLPYSDRMDGCRIYVNETFRNEDGQRVMRIADFALPLQESGQEIGYRYSERLAELRTRHRKAETDRGPVLRRHGNRLGLTIGSNYQLWVSSQEHNPGLLELINRREAATRLLGALSSMKESTYVSVRTIRRLTV